MAAHIKSLKDSDGNTIYPQTKTKAVYGDNGKRLDNLLSETNQTIEDLANTTIRVNNFIQNGTVASNIMRLFKSGQRGGTFFVSQSTATDIPVSGRIKFDADIQFTEEILVELSQIGGIAIYQNTLIHSTGQWKYEWALNAIVKEPTIFNFTIQSGYKKISECTYLKKNGWVYVQGEYANTADTVISANTIMYPLSLLPVGFKPLRVTNICTCGSYIDELTPLVPIGGIISTAGNFTFVNRNQQSKRIGFNGAFYVGGETV